MFTSRAEFRLTLREDNADLRLTGSRPAARPRRLGTLDFIPAKTRAYRLAELERLRSTWVNPKTLDAAARERLYGSGSLRESTLLDLLKRPGVTYADIARLLPIQTPVDDPNVAQQVETTIKYQGYIDRQQGEVERQLRYENMRATRHARLRDADRIVTRSTAEAQSTQTGNARPGSPNLRHHSRDHFAAAGASQAWFRRNTEIGVMEPDTLPRGLVELGLDLGPDAEDRLMRYLAPDRKMEQGVQPDGDQGRARHGVRAPAG